MSKTRMRLKKRINTYIEKLPSGGATINDVVIHSANPHLPFGGKGGAGFGCYHSRYSFETFSHQRAVVWQSLLLDAPVRYAPYKKKLGIVKN